MKPNRPTVPPAPRQPVLITCAWCARTKVGSQWREPGLAAHGGMISHGICPACYAAQLAKVPRGYARG